MPPFIAGPVPHGDVSTVCQSEAVFPQQLALLPHHVLVTSQGPRPQDGSCGSRESLQIAMVILVPLMHKIYLKPIFHCDAKLFALGPRVGLDPQGHNFASEISTCLRYPQRERLNLRYPLTTTTNASRWNIGGVGSPTRGADVGHVVTFHIFCVDFICVG